MRTPTTYEEALALPPGTSFRLYFGPDHTSNQLLHLRAVVDRRLVLRQWGRYARQRWCYEVRGEPWWIVNHDLLRDFKSGANPSAGRPIDAEA